MHHYITADSLLSFGDSHAENLLWHPWYGSNPRKKNYFPFRNIRPTRIMDNIIVDSNSPVTALLKASNCTIRVFGLNETPCSKQAVQQLWMVQIWPLKMPQDQRSGTPEGVLPPPKSPISAIVGQPPSCRVSEHKEIIPSVVATILSCHRNYTQPCCHWWHPRFCHEQDSWPTRRGKLSEKLRSPPVLLADW